MHPNALLNACADLIERMSRFDQPADALATRFFRDHRRLGPRERATVAETAYAVLRRKPCLDWLARSGVGAAGRRLAILGFAGDAGFLQAALTPRESEWLKHCRALAPEDLPDCCVHNLPDWLWRRLQQQAGVDARALAQALQEPAPMDLRVNDWRFKRAEVTRQLADSGVRVQETTYSPWGLRVQGHPSLQRHPLLLAGAFEVQDEGSQLLALLVDAHRGEMVVDFCAGAGGKTLAMGACMRNTGRLYAWDVSAARLDALKPRLARSGLSNVHPAVLAHERDDRVKRLAGKVDRVLVDAPCSGSGTLRRNPDLKWRQTESALGELVRKQTAILHSAARLTKPGGRLVYATCSLLRDENEDVAQAFSDAHPDFEPVAAAAVLQDAGVSQAHGLCSGGVQGDRYLRLWPHLHHTDGFFAAVWQRRF